jgi:moderate conductance mechanosensitive channel
MFPFASRLILAVLAGSLALSARAEAPAGPAQTVAPAGPATQAATLTPAQVQQALAVLNDDQRRAALVSTLEAIAKAQAAERAVPAAPAAPPAAPAEAASKTAPGTAPEAAPKTETKPAVAAKVIQDSLSQNGLAWRLLVQASAALQNAGAKLTMTVQAVNDLPVLGYWLTNQVESPAARARTLQALWRLAVVLAAALAIEWIAVRLLRRLRATIARWAPSTASGVVRVSGGAARASAAEESGLAGAEAGESEHVVRQGRLTGAVRLLRRLPYSVGRLLLDLVPVAVFMAVGSVLLGATPLGAIGTTRLATRAVLEAYVVYRLAECVTRMLVAPRQPKLRLVHISTEDAHFALRIVRMVAAIGAFGWALGQVGLMLGMYPSARLAWMKLVALIVHAILIGAVLRVRAPIAQRLRAPPDRTGVLVTLRNRLASRWHLIAIFWLVATWLVWAVEIQDGFTRLFAFFTSTMIVLILARLVAIMLLGGVDRVFRLGPERLHLNPGLERRASFYYPIIRQLTSALLAALTALALFEAWGFAPLGWLAGSYLGSETVAALGLIALTLLIAVVAWEAANIGFERYLARLSDSDQPGRAARLRTLLPFLRTTLLVTIVTIVSLTVLSEIGVNIAPLLAGAGVIGIAVGFGSQKLVQDLITGLFLLMENAMQVGDWVTVAGLSGTVETLSIRTIRLRAGDGSIHIIPFSSVTTVNNTNRDFAYAAVSVGVAYTEDTDRVGEELGRIVGEMRGDPLFRRQILSDFSLWGVDQLGDFAVTIKGQVQTTAAGRWPVQREINRRVKKRFEALGIEIPFPVHTVLVGDAAPRHLPGLQRADHTDAADPPPRRTDLTSPPPAAMDHTA